MPLPGVPAAAGQLITILGPQALAWLEDRLTKPHGSKVKKGAYKDCLIELDESKEYAFIVVDPARGNILYLTSDTIQSCEYVKKAKKRRYLEYKTYYYYDITFKDGNRSYVRMRKKYRNAMFNHMTDHM